MPRMLRELVGTESGLLGYVLLTARPVRTTWSSTGSPRRSSTRTPRLAGQDHHRAWAVFNRKERAGKSRQHVGMWHETYVVPEGSHESIYDDMPPFGLGPAYGTVPLEKRGRRAQDRFRYRSAGAAEETR